MNFQSLVGALMGTRPLPKPRGKAARAASAKAADRRVVSTLSTGNIRLQQGKFSTKSDLERERERVLAAKL